MTMLRAMGLCEILGHTFKIKMHFSPFPTSFFSFCASGWRILMVVRQLQPGGQGQSQENGRIWVPRWPSEQGSLSILNWYAKVVF